MILIIGRFLLLLCYFMLFNYLRGKLLSFLVFENGPT